MVRRFCSAVKRCSVKPAFANELLEAGAVELAVQSLEARIVHDLARDLGVRDVEAKLARALVEGGFGDELADELLVEAQRLA